MSWTRISGIMLRQYYLTRDNITRMTQVFLWPFLDIVMWGFISQYLDTFGTGNFIATLLGAVVLWDFLSRVMTGITMTFFEDVWARNFLNMFASPLLVSEYVIGMIGTTIVTSAVAFAGMLLAAGVLFGFSIGVYGIALLPFLIILFASGVALGIFAVGVILRFGPSAEWFIWPMPAILAPFVGVFYPISTLPEWMQKVAHVLPPTHVFEGVRAIIAGEAFPLAPLMWGIALSIIFIALAYFYFLRIYRRAVRTGLIARYSAETVS